jgi:hypothetical protein
MKHSTTLNRHEQAALSNRQCVLALGAGAILLGSSASLFAANIPATRMDCQGPLVNVVYHTGTIGKPRLGISRPGEPIVKNLKEPEVQSTVLGSLATITAEAIPDDSTESFTFLAPDVNVPSEQPFMSFNTVLFKTVTHTTIAGPGGVAGVIQESVAVPLVCRATTLLL